MRPIIFTDLVRADIARVVAYAEQNAMTLEAMKARADVKYAKTDRPNQNLDEQLKETDPDRKTVPRDYGLECVIPFGVHCCFSIEQQPAPLGWCRHLSIRLQDSRNLLHPAAFAEIAKLFGFRQPIPDLRHPPHNIVYVEDGHAMNVIEPKEDMEIPWEKPEPGESDPRDDRPPMECS